MSSLFFYWKGPKSGISTFSSNYSAQCRGWIIGAENRQKWLYFFLIHLMISSNIKWAVSQRRLLQVKYLGGIQGPLALRRLALRHFFVLLHIPRQNTIWPKHLSRQIFRLWPNAAHRWHFALQDVSHRQSCHLSTPSHLQVPPVWPYCRQAQCGCWFTV